MVLPVNLTKLLAPNSETVCYCPVKKDFCLENSAFLKNKQLLTLLKKNKKQNKNKQTNKQKNKQKMKKNKKQNIDKRLIIIKNWRSILLLNLF